MLFAPRKMPLVDYSKHIFNQSAVPGGGGSGTYELGTKFHSDSVGHIVELGKWRFTGDLLAYICRLWDATGILLATATLPASSKVGYDYVPLVIPVAIAAMVDYTVSYSVSGPYIAGGIYLGASPLFNSIVPGVYTPSVGTFPTLTYATVNYAADVGFV